MSKENLVIISSLGALALVVLFLIMPAFDSMSLDRQIVAGRESDLEQANLFNQKIEGLKNQYKSNELESLLSVLPKQEELSALLIQLEGLATGNGLIMESVDFSKTDETQAQAPQATEETQPGVVNTEGIKATPYRILLVSLKLSGQYSAFKNYLQAVEKNSRLMDVTSLELSGNSSATGYFNFTVNLRVYYQ